MRRLVAVSSLAVALILAGCASSSDTNGGGEAAPTKTATASPSPSPKPTKTATPTPTPRASPSIRQIGFDCMVETPGKYTWERPSYSSVVFFSLQEAWAYTGGVISSCDMRIMKAGAVSTTEEQAVAAAGYDSPSDVKYLWEICADRDHLYATNGALNPNQQAEANGALMLCPDHPGAAIMANGSPEQNERNAGLRFGDGVREVNTTIQPGTYRSTGPVENCYWARLDAAGEIIDNNFIASATQIEINVAASDFSLHTEGCGEVVKVG